jgi:hypothetical protein
VKSNSKQSSNQDEEDQEPFQIMDTRIIAVQFPIDNTFDENPATSNQAEPCSNVPENNPPGRGRLKGKRHCCDEKPEVPEDDQVETQMEQKEEIPEAPVPMVKFPQKKNIEDHSSQFLCEAVRTSLPPIYQFINRTPSMEFPAEV